MLSLPCLSPYSLRTQGLLYEPSGWHPAGMPVLLSRSQARRAAAACRSLAYVHRRDLDNYGPPTRAIIEKEVRELERLAAVFDEHATGKGPPNGQECR